MADENENVLTPEEVQRLMDSSTDKKNEITRNVAKYYKSSSCEPKQIKLAEEVFHSLLKDTEVAVRKNLSESIKNLSGISNDVVLTLAQDIAEVSLPVLQFSEVLSEDDILGIIQSTESETKHIAISKRKTVSEKVSHALIDTKTESVIGSLMQNKGAEVSEEGLRQIVEEHSNSEVVLGSMIERGSLPVSVVERITGTISNEIYKQLEKKHMNALAQFEQVIAQSREATEMQVMGLKGADENLVQFTNLLKSLKISEEVTPIAALCMENTNLFEVSVAKKTKVPVLNIRELLKDESNQGFAAIYQRAGLPEKFLAASTMLMDIIRNKYKNNMESRTEIKLTPDEAETFIRDIAAEIEKKGKPDEIEYVVSLIKRMTD